MKKENENDLNKIYNKQKKLYVKDKSERKYLIYKRKDDYSFYLLF